MCDCTVCVCVHMCVSPYACVYKFVCVCVCVCLCVCVLSICTYVTVCVCSCYACLSLIQDVLFDATDHRAKKFIMHTNIPGDYNFDMCVMPPSILPSILIQI